MKKRRSLLWMVMLLVGLTACGGASDKAETGASDSGAASTEETDEKADAAEASVPDVPGETIEVGEFSVLVPEGWNYEIANGTSIKIYKGAIEENNANIDLRLYNGDYYDGAVDTMLGDEAEDIGTITTGSITWKGMQGNYLLFDTMAVLGTDSPAYFVAFSDLTGTKDVSESSFALTDADVQALLGSLTLTAEE